MQNFIDYLFIPLDGYIAPGTNPVISGNIYKLTLNLLIS